MEIELPEDQVSDLNQLREMNKILEKYGRSIKAEIDQIEMDLIARAAGLEIL